MGAYQQQVHELWPNESCWEFRLGTWPQLMLLQSFHLAAIELVHAATASRTFQQTGVSAAVCQTSGGTGGSGHLQAGHRLPQRGRQEHTRPGDSAKGQKGTVPTGSPRAVRLRQLTYMTIAKDKKQACCRVAPKEVPLWPWVTRALQSSVCHASPMN